MPLPLSVCRLETADEVKCGNATDKALAGEVLMELLIIFGIMGFILYIVGFIDKILSDNNK